MAARSPSQLLATFGGTQPPICGDWDGGIKPERVSPSLSKYRDPKHPQFQPLLRNRKSLWGGNWQLYQNRTCVPTARLRQAYQDNLSLFIHRLSQRPQGVKTVNRNGSRKARAHRALCWADLPPRVHTGGLLSRVKPGSPCRGFAAGLVQRTCQRVPTVILTHSSHRRKKKNEWSRARVDALSPKSNLTSAQRRPKHSAEWSLAQMWLARQITTLPL